MEIYQKILDLIFPCFEKSQESRFNKFFEENGNKYVEHKTFKLNGYKINTGEYKRTSIIIKNIPKNMTKNQFYYDGSTNTTLIVF